MSAELHSAASMHLEGIAGRTAVVTGAASGIGRCVATTFAALGARVGGIDVAGDAPGGVLLRTADVRARDAVHGAFDELERELGPVELLVTSAGVFREIALAELGADD